MPFHSVAGDQFVGWDGRSRRKIFLGVDARLRKHTRTRATSKENEASRLTSMMAHRPCTEVLIQCREGHVPLTTLSRRVIAAHSRLPQAHWHRNQAADLAAASCEMASCHIASSHSMHEAPSPHTSAPTGTTHERSLGHAMPGRTVHDMQGGCGSREPAAARRAPAPDEFGCRCATHISDGQRGLPPGDPEGSSLLASPPAAAESDGRQRVPRRRAPHGTV